MINSSIVSDSSKSENDEKKESSVTKSNEIEDDDFENESFSTFDRVEKVIRISSFFEVEEVDAQMKSSFAKNSRLRAEFDNQQQARRSIRERQSMQISQEDTKVKRLMRHLQF